MPPHLTVFKPSLAEPMAGVIISTYDELFGEKESGRKGRGRQPAPPRARLSAGGRAAAV